MRPRFRLRTLLILTALAAAACYWWIVRPTIVANRFIAAVNRDDYAAADQMFAEPDAHYLDPRYQRGHVYSMPGNWRARLLPRSWRELSRGYRAIEVYKSDGTYKFRSDFVRATARGNIAIVSYDDYLYDEFATWQSNASTKN